jgi:putative acetyltransferase
MSAPPKGQDSAGAGAFRIESPYADLSLVDLWVESWQAAMPQIDFVARREWFVAHLLALKVAGALTICGFDGEGHLAGFVLLLVQRNYLEQIAVHPRHFGDGLARRLLDEAKARCPNGLTLDVNIDNARALRFYQRQGFARVAAGTNSLSGLPTFTMHWP